jgi:hypothetical protein
VAELAPIADAAAGSLWRVLWADIVAKRFWVSEEATLIQDQRAIRKVDSKICSFRFDCRAQAPLADFCNNIGQNLTHAPQQTPAFPARRPA